MVELECEVLRVGISKIPGAKKKQAPEWWNIGRHAGFRHQCHVRESSNLSSGNKRSYKAIIMSKKNITAKRKAVLDPELLKAIFYCPILKKNVEVEKSLISFHGYSHPGGLQQDGYSEVNVSFMCECGDSHHITIYDD